MRRMSLVLSLVLILVTSMKADTPAQPLREQIEVFVGYGSFQAKPDQNITPDMLEKAMPNRAEGATVIMVNQQGIVVDIKKSDKYGKTTWPQQVGMYSVLVVSPGKPAQINQVGDPTARKLFFFIPLATPTA